MFMKILSNKSYKMMAITDSSRSIKYIYMERERKKISANKSSRSIQIKASQTTRQEKERIKKWRRDRSVYRYNFFACFIMNLHTKKDACVCVCAALISE